MSSKSNMSFMKKKRAPPDSSDSELDRTPRQSKKKRLRHFDKPGTPSPSEYKTCSSDDTCGEAGGSSAEKIFLRSLTPRRFRKKKLEMEKKAIATIRSIDEGNLRVSEMFKLIQNPADVKIKECFVCDLSLIMDCQKCREREWNFVICEIAFGKCGHMFHDHCVKSVGAKHRCPKCLEIWELDKLVCTVSDEDYQTLKNAKLSDDEDDEDWIPPTETEEDESEEDESGVDEFEEEESEEDESEEDESGVDESENDESEKEVSQKVEIKKEVSQKVEIKKEVSQKVEIKKEDSKMVEIKKEDSEKVEIKKEDSEKVEIKKEDSEKVEIKKEDSKKVEIKKEESE